MRRAAIALGLICALGAGAGLWLRGDVLAAGPEGEGRKAPAEQPIAVSTAIAKSANFPIRRRSIGVMESPATVVLRSRIDSQIMEQHVTDGQIVEAGDLLFTLDDREVKASLARAQAALAKDQAAQVRAEQDLERVRKLLAKNAAARQQLDQATADEKSAAAQVASDKAQIETETLRLSYTKIKAPISGRIGAVRVTPGNLVSANDMSGQGMVTITQLSPIRVSFTLPEKDLPLLQEAYWRNKPDRKAMVRVLEPGSEKVLGEAPLDFLDSTVDSASGTLTAKATFANKDYRLVPGQYVDVVIDLDTKPGTVMVPTVAVQTGQSGPFVFVVNNKSRIEVKPITLIGAEGDKTAIESGLKAGTHVVIEGQLKLDRGSLVAETLKGEDFADAAATGSLGKRRPGALAEQGEPATTAR